MNAAATLQVCAEQREVLWVTKFKKSMKEKCQMDDTSTFTYVRTEKLQPLQLFFFAAGHQLLQLCTYQSICYKWDDTDASV